MRGGGNSLNIIRVPSLNELEDIILKSDLNGTITPGLNLVWNKTSSYYTWLQNNNTGNAYLGDDLTENNIYSNKAETSNYYNTYRYTFRPIIEYRE